MLIRGAHVFQEDGRFADSDISIAGEVFADGSGEGEVIDAAGCYAIPGMIDLHIHGCAGHEFSDADEAGLEEMLRFQARQGVTAICPTTPTLAEPVLAKACRAISTLQCGDGAAVVGIHLEGPFVSPDKLGAQNPEHVAAPDPTFFHRLQAAANGMIKLMDVAPELEGAMELIASLRNDVRCGIAHTAADYDTAMLAFRVGAAQVAHLFNAMPPLAHRAPGVVGAAFDTPECCVELICDGVHVHPSVVRIAFQMFGDDRILLISDSMMATGQGDGSYQLGGLAVTVQGSTARLTGGDAIAGSVTTLADCLRTAVRDMGIPLESAVKCATQNPAKALGIFGERGSITPGKAADLVLLEPDLTLRQVILRGCALLA